MDPHVDQLVRIASVMDALRGDSSAKLGYDVLADALVWTDEYPDFANPAYAHIPLKDFECMRLVLGYRTSIILGSPDAGCERYWIEAARLFPSWCGFRIERRAAVLRDEFFRLRRDSLDEVNQVSKCEVRSRKSNNALG